MVHSNTVFPLCVCNANVQNPICNQASKKIESLQGIVINLLPGYLAQNSPFDNAVAFCITLHAGSTLHLADGLIGFAGFTTRNVASGGDGQNTAITNVGLEHTLPMAMQFVVGVHNFDFRCQKFFRRWCQGVFGHG